MTDVVPDQTTDVVTEQVTDVKQNRSEQLKEARKRKADLAKQRDEKLARIEEQLSALTAERQKKNKRKRDDDDDEPDQPKKLNDSDEDDNDSVLPTRVTKIQKTEDPPEEEDGETWTTSIFRNGALLGLAGASYYLQHVWNKPRPVPPVQNEPPPTKAKQPAHPVRPAPVRPVSAPQPEKKEAPLKFVGTTGFVA